MLNHKFNQLNNRIYLALRAGVSLTFVFLLIEFFDELAYGIDNAVLPVLRQDLAISYAQVGLLLGLPIVVSTVIEPFLMLMGDTHLRKHLVVGGGLAVCLSMFMIAGAGSFWPVMLAMMIAYPASGAFVTLSQATLMDLNPGREAKMMARWTLSGSLGDLIGPLLLAAGFALGLGWRWAFTVMAGLALILTLVVWAKRFPPHSGASEDADGHPDLRALWQGLRQALADPGLMRWVILLQFSDLLLDVYTGYAALYFADVVGLSAAQTSLVLGLLMAAGIVSDVILIPLLERFPGRSIVRLSAGTVALLYAAWLLAPGAAAKIILAVLIKLCNLGWYSVLQGEAYAAAPGKSGTVMAISSVVGILGGALVWLVGWTAGQVGLDTAMWLLLLGPVSLALFVPRPVKMRPEPHESAE